MKVGDPANEEGQKSASGGRQQPARLGRATSALPFRPRGPRERNQRRDANGVQRREHNSTMKTTADRCRVAPCGSPSSACSRSCRGRTHHGACGLGGQARGARGATSWTTSVNLRCAWRLREADDQGATSGRSVENTATLRAPSGRSACQGQPARAGRSSCPRGRRSRLPSRDEGNPRLTRLLSSRRSPASPAPSRRWRLRRRWWPPTWRWRRRRWRRYLGGLRQEVRTMTATCWAK